MAQHDYAIANQGFPAFRSDLNDALAAIVSNNSGATEPTTMFAHQMWVDTAANPSVLKIRNADNDAWITIGSIDQTGDTFTLVNLRTSGPVVFNDAGADVDFRVEGDTDANLLFVDASTDRVGVGTNSPAVDLNVVGTTGIRSERSGGASITMVAGSSGEARLDTSIASRVFQVNSDASISINATSGVVSGSVNIDSSGNLLVGTTTNASGASIATTSSVPFTALVPVILARSATATASIVSISNSTATRTHCVFETSAATVGSITTASSSTAYNTSSDYRLKDNVAPMTGALAKVLELNPVTYTWKVDGSAGEGFIAHELQAVCPEAVTGEKDATEIGKVEVSPAVPATYDEEGNELTPAVEAVYEEREVPKYQGVDTSFLVATLTAAIQELKAELDAAKERIAALENA